MTAEEQLEQCLPRDRVEWFRRQLNAWGKANLRDFPWRNTQDAYAIFVAECLLQKTDAATVLPFYQTFLERYPTVSVLAATPVGEVAELLQPLGLFFRAERLVEAAKVLQSQYQGKIPQTEAELLKLPGVGKYTARSILAHAFKQPASILDTNVARIFERFFGLQGDRVKSRCPLLWKATEIALPARNISRWNLILLDFGAAVCTAKSPRCSECPLRAAARNPAELRCQFVRRTSD